MMEARIRDGLSALGIDAPTAPPLLARYGELLIEKNQVMNLTAITQPHQVADLHFLDSAALLGAADFRGKRVIDVGTGAGFPGVVLKVLEPTVELTLLDGLQKRLDWLESVCVELGLGAVKRLHGRAEEFSLQSAHRDAYDIATARAVADLRLLCELCLPYVKVGGYFLAMKSVNCDEELSTAMASIRLLGGKVLSPYDYAIPGTDVKHRIIIIEKATPTPKGYPRRWAKIQKTPL